MVGRIPLEHLAPIILKLILHDNFLNHKPCSRMEWAVAERKNKTILDIIRTLLSDLIFQVTFGQKLFELHVIS